jgi:hypothetical protein
MRDDDPGAGVEPDALVAHARAERVAQSREGAGCGGGIEPLQECVRRREAANPVEGGGRVWAVVDGFVDVGEADIGEPCGPCVPSYSATAVPS